MLKNNSNNDYLKEFEPDDEKYLSWIKENTDGFILTSNKSLSPRATVIHKASCDKITILTGNAKSFTESGYVKVYATKTTLLEDWVRQKRVDGITRHCSLCF